MPHAVPLSLLSVCKRADKTTDFQTGSPCILLHGFEFSQVSRFGIVKLITSKDSVDIFQWLCYDKVKQYKGGDYWK